MLEEPRIIGELANLLRVRPELQLICRFGAQWASPHAPEEEGWAPFHIVTSGTCLLDAGPDTGIRLEAGDAVVLPHGGPHTIRSLGTSQTGGGTLDRTRIDTRANDDILLRQSLDAEPDTGLICGRLRFEQAHRNMVLAALPPVVRLSGTGGPDAGRLKRLVELIQAELETDRVGAAAIAADLASALMMLVLRSHLEGNGAASGVLALMARRQTARVLAAMLDDPAHPWSLDDLAAEAATSRASLVRMFRQAAGMAPLAFLAELRLTLARHRLIASTASVAEIGETVGYQSETAFSRAYQRRFAISPGADRKRA
ncbi:MAG TPA: AraC family transcriptional regulator [Stellaceae bacterium]|nr:AraC family transcriptional regulator [Stellaceae bacterium]